jgi:hypothetical protein
MAMNEGPMLMPLGRSGSEPRRCSFCGRREQAVEHLVRVRVTYICDRCVAQAHEAIASAPPGQRLLRMKPTPGRVGDADAAEEAIEHAFETALDAEASIVDRCRAIERGADLGSAMDELRARYAPAQNVDVSVDYVRFVSDDEAEVRYSLLLPHLGPSGFVQTGHARLVEGEWKMSRDTWCNLVSMAGVQCPPAEE